MASVGDYDLETQIGAGASGTVWRARQRGPVARAVALKRLRAGGGAADVARLEREATVLTDLDHPHVVRVLEVLHDDGGIAIAMQHAPGGSLADLLAERGRLAPGEVVAVAAPVADALASAHRRGVLHGDVKPANILFTSDGEPLLGDFGVARTLGHATGDQVTGTAEYLAPELLAGGRPDPRADVYALGVVCYQALTGRPPYTGPVPLAVARAADAGVHDRLDDDPAVPDALARVVEQAMARDPGARVATAGELARALRATVPAGEIRVPGPSSGPGRVAAGDVAAVPTTTFGPRPPRPVPEAPRRSRRVPALVGVGLAAAGGIALVRGPLAPGGDGCPGGPAPGAGAAAQVVRGDVDGTGCTVTGVYGPQATASDGTVMVLRIAIGGDEKMISLGEAGDQVVLGDWDCDGVDTPALYRRGAGVVQYFDVWPEVARQTYRPSSSAEVAAGGTAERVAAPGEDGGRRRCDEVRVSPRPEDRSRSAIMGPAGGPPAR